MVALLAGLPGRVRAGRGHGVNGITDLAERRQAKRSAAARRAAAGRRPARPGANGRVNVPLTRAQVRHLAGHLAIVLNDPTWPYGAGEARALAAIRNTLDKIEGPR